MGMLGFEIVATVSQIISCIVVLALSVHEKPHASLRTWIIGYLTGCVATLPFFYWLYPYRHQGVVSVFQDMRLGKLTLSFKRFHGIALVESQPPVYSRLGPMADFFRIVVYFFFITWFVLGVVWISEGSSRADAPKLFWTCISLLITCGLAYAISFVFLVAELFYCCWCCPSSTRAF